MEISVMLNQFKAFFTENEASLELARGVVIVDFRLLSVFDAELGKSLLVSPEETIKASEIAFESIKKMRCYVRFKNIPDSCGMSIGNIRTSHIGRFIKVAAVIKGKSDIRPLIVSIKFECPSCGNVMRILQLTQKVREPSKCGCGRRGKFKPLSKDMVDSQTITVMDKTNKKIEVYLKADLVEKKLGLGRLYMISGVLREVPVMIGKVQSTTLDLQIDANNIEDLNAG